jgi:hypothetical protein
MPKRSAGFDTGAGLSFGQDNVDVTVDIGIEVIRNRSKMYFLFGMGNQSGAVTYFFLELPLHWPL